MARHIKQMLSTAIGKKNWNLVRAYRLERVKSNLGFLRECRRRQVIPRGFCTGKKLKDTIPECSNNHRRVALQCRHSHQWMQLAIDELYDKVAYISGGAVFPMCTVDFGRLNHYCFRLRCIKRAKMAQILPHEDGTMVPPEGFTNLSNASLLQSLRDC